jgi:uncharacterized membrane protein
VLSGLVLLLTMVSLLVRQWFHGSHLDVGSVDFIERSTYVVAWLALALATLVARDKWPLPVLGFFGTVLSAFALVVSVFVGLGFANPVFSGEPVGSLPVANWLLWGYGVPAIFCLALARRAEREPNYGRLVALALRGVTLVLLFSLVTLEVRQAFQGPVLTQAWSAAERYSYSLAWIVFATALLVIGIARRSQGPRYASLAVMMVAVAKVFLYDTGNVTDLLRVFSYLGLGLSLLLLAWLYQRFVFVERGA